MPIYEYECQKCKKHFEFTQKISEAPKTKCPECAGKLEKQVSSTSFQLKGDGWYASGYSKTPTKSEPKKD